MRFEKSENLLKLALMMQASNDGIALQDIEEEFAVSRRTAERMRNALMSVFPQIEEVERDGRTKYWRLPAKALTGLIQISAEELAQMKTAIDILRKENLLHHAEQLHTLWLKIIGLMRRENAARIETDLEVLLEAEGHAMRAGPRLKVSPDVLQTLREALKAPFKVKITYRSRSKDELKERIVHPYGFVYGWRHYLLAWCEDVQALRTFSLPNITACALQADSYEKDPAFDLETYVQRSFGVFQEEPYPVVWRFAAEIAEAAKEHYFHPTQILEDQPDGSLIVRFTAGGKKEMCWYVMTWEGGLEILEPAHLREAYQEMVSKLALLPDRN